MVIFIGQNPAKGMKKNDPPFYNTVSWNNLRTWIAMMNPESFIMYNAADKKGDVCKKDFNEFYYPLFSVYQLYGHKFVALGKYASEFLEAGGIKHYTLPHPSPKNRLLNDKKAVDKALKECKEFINGN